MNYINFLGCSPALSSGNVESIVRLHVFDCAVALGGESIETIRYPKCKHVISHPNTLLADYSPNRPWKCPECGNCGQLAEINWRKSFGYSSYFIEITSIFPKEALPGENLLNRLNTCSHTDWSWFYSRSSN